MCAVGLESLEADCDCDVRWRWLDGIFVEGFNSQPPYGAVRNIYRSYYVMSNSQIEFAKMSESPACWMLPYIFTLDDEQVHK